MAEVSKLTRSFPLHADHHNQGQGNLVEGHTALIALKDGPEHGIVWGDSIRVPLVKNSLIAFRGNTTHGIPMIPNPDSDGDNDDNNQVHHLGPFCLALLDPVGECGFCMFVTDCGTNEVCGTDGCCRCGTGLGMSSVVCGGGTICEPASSSCVPLPPSCQYVPECNVPFVVVGDCDLEGILECSSATLPMGTEVCAQCSSIAERRQLGRRKSSKGKSSSSDVMMPLPMPDEFEITLNIPGICESTGTYNALSATVSCVGPDGSTYTLKISVPELVSDSSMGKSRRARGLNQQDNTLDFGSDTDRILRMRMGMKKKKNVSASAKSAVDDDAPQVCVIVS